MSNMRHFSRVAAASTQIYEGVAARRTAVYAGSNRAAGQRGWGQRWSTVNRGVLPGTTCDVGCCNDLGIPMPHLEPTLIMQQRSRAICASHAKGNATPASGPLNLGARVTPLSGLAARQTGTDANTTLPS